MGPFSYTCLFLFFLVCFVLVEFSFLARKIFQFKMPGDDEPTDVQGGSAKPAFNRLTVNSSLEQFCIWDLRFHSHAIQRQGDLAMFFDPGTDSSQGALAKKAQQRLFSSQLFLTIYLKYTKTGCDGRAK
jgi:hypothetical protein